MSCNSSFIQSFVFAFHAPMILFAGSFLLVHNPLRICCKHERGFTFYLVVIYEIQWHSAHRSNATIILFNCTYCYILRE